MTLAEQNAKLFKEAKEIRDYLEARGVPADVALAISKFHRLNGPLTKVILQR